MINAQTKIIGLLGHPVKHSFSPNIHNYLFEKYSQNNVYCCFDVEENNIDKFVDSIKVLDMKGCNVTIPHKVSIMKYLDDIDKNTKLIGAVNTIKHSGNKLIGYNTDGLGFIKSILDKNHIIKNKKIMIIGAGGASRSIAIQLANQNAKTIEIRNRSIENSVKISEIINKNFETKAIYSTKKIEKIDLEDIDILINTTPIGMESEKCPIDTDIIVDKKILVCDIVYKPQNTTFLKWAKNNNLDVIYGIDMLINQALEAFYIWTEIKPTKEDEMYLRGLYNKNIY